MLRVSSQVEGAAHQTSAQFLELASNARLKGQRVLPCPCTLSSALESCRWFHVSAREGQKLGMSQRFCEGTEPSQGQCRSLRLRGQGIQIFANPVFRKEVPEQRADF